MEKYADDAVIYSAEFGQIVHLALESKVLTTGDIARKWGVNPSTVEKWAEGKGRLHMAVRPLVLNWLIDKMNAKA